MTEPGPPLQSRPRGKRERSSGTDTHEVRGGTLAPSATPNRPVPRWIFAAIVAFPLLALLVYFLVDAGRGTADVGQTLTEKSGVELTVSTPQTYAVNDAPPVAAGEKLSHVIIAVNNPTDKVMSSSDFTITATVDDVAVEAVPPADGPINQLIEPNVQLNIPFVFKIKEGMHGRLQITVQSGDRTPMYFNGTV